MSKRIQIKVIDSNNNNDDDKLKKKPPSRAGLLFVAFIFFVLILLIRNYLILDEHFNGSSENESIGVVNELIINNDS